MSCDMYDNALLGILQNEGEIVKFLDVFFSFLYRKTDFYLLMKSPYDRMGFPPGAAQKLVVSTFKKYETLAKQNDARRQKQQTTTPENPDSTHSPITGEVDIPQVAAVEEIVTSSSESAADNIGKSVNSVHTTAAATADSCARSQSTNDTRLAAENSTTEQQRPENNSAAASVVDQPVASADSVAVEKTEAADDDPELAKLQKQFQANPESYNGAVRDNYSWSQSISDVDIRVQVPSHIRRGADVKVDITKKHLRVSYKDVQGKTVDAVDGELTWDIHKDESIWSLVPGEHVHVNLEKVQERWWDAVLTNEPKISVRKIDPSRPMTDLDDEAQAKIEELMYNERQKRLGLPQSHEQKVHEMLRQAWDAEGSPFKGTPFDPSIVNVTPNS